MRLDRSGVVSCHGSYKKLGAERATREWVWGRGLPSPVTGFRMSPVERFFKYIGANWCNMVHFCGQGQNADL